VKLMSVAKDRGHRMIAGWQSFWFTPEPAYTLGIVRMAFGVLMIGWTLLLASDLNVAFGTTGVVPQPPSRTYTWGLFHVYTSDSAILVGWLVLLLASVALAVGWHSRLAAVLAFLLILSFERRNPVIFNSGDTVIRIVALYLSLSPCGAALSLDQRRRTGSFFNAREIRPWPLRLIQIQLTLIYTATVIAKLAGETWQNGTAVSFSLRQRDLLIVPPPDWFALNLLISNTLTWGTLIIELGIAILVWKRAWRPWVLASGVALHLGISLFLEVGFFSFAMFILYLAFIPPERAEALARGVQSRLLRMKAGLIDGFMGSDTGSDEDDEVADESPARKRQPAGAKPPAGGETGQRHGEETPAPVPPKRRPAEVPLRVKLPTEIFADSSEERRPPRVVGSTSEIRKVGDTGVAIPLTVHSPGADTHVAGRHAQRNGQLTGHPS
jgi:hypothetical protein